MRALSSSASRPRATAIAVIACAAVIATAVPASAAEGGSWTYRGPRECTYNKAVIATPAAERAAAVGTSQVQAWKNSPAEPCRQADQRPAGHLRATADLYKWDDLLSGWRLCRSSGPVTNNVAGWQLEARVALRTSSGSMACGNGWYGTMASGWQFSPSRNTWVGGAVWSGHHFFAPVATPLTPPPSSAPRADEVLATLVSIPAQS